MAFPRYTKLNIDAEDAWTYAFRNMRVGRMIDPAKLFNMDSFQRPILEDIPIPEHFNCRSVEGFWDQKEALLTLLKQPGISVEADSHSININEEVEEIVYIVKRKLNYLNNQKKEKGENKMSYGLNNKTTWTDAKGQEHDVKDLDEEYLKNIVGHLSCQLVNNKKSLEKLDKKDDAEKIAYSLFEKELEKVKSDLKVINKEYQKRIKPKRKLLG